MVCIRPARLAASHGEYPHAYWMARESRWSLYYNNNNNNNNNIQLTPASIPCTVPLAVPLYTSPPASPLVLADGIKTAKKTNYSFQRITEARSENNIIR